MGKTDYINYKFVNLCFVLLKKTYVVHIYSLISFIILFISITKVRVLYILFFHPKQQISFFHFPQINIKNMYTIKITMKYSHCLLWGRRSMITITFALGFCLVQNQRNIPFHFLRKHYFIMETSVFSLILLPHARSSKVFRPLWGQIENSKQ